MLLNVVYQGFLELGHLEPIVGFGKALYFPPITFLVFFLRQETFFGHRIPTFILRLVNQILFPQFLEDVLHRLDVMRLGSANELIETDIQYPPLILEVAHIFVAVLLGGNTPFSCRLLDFLAVFVGSREEISIIAAVAVKSSQDIR